MEPLKTGKTQVPDAVLVVEDDPLIRLDTALAFSDAGFSVIETGNADDALEIIRSRSHIGLVFTDIEMPSVHDGLSLAQIVARDRPEIDVFVTSGRHLPHGRDGAMKFVSKPYDPRAVISRIKAMRARRGSAS